MSTDLLNQWINLYREPMFWLYPMATLGISIGAFLLFALPLTLLAWIDPPALQRFKVQPGPFHVERWFWGSLGRLFGNALLMAALLVLAWPVLRYTTIHTGALPAWWVIGLQLLFFIFLDDFLYYGMHRAMHKGWLLRQVHSVHHRIRQTSAINGNYFHPLEFIFTGTLVLVGPLLVGAHLYVLWIWVALRQFEAADGHCGYVFPWNPGHLLPLYEGAGFHDFHHLQYQGNFAGFLPWLDGVFGTYARGYREWRAARKTPH
ncbi:MAG: sterol desaturase family protein [bacterium]|nr:sterol desaturase family protein [bacterium]